MRQTHRLGLPGALPETVQLASPLPVAVRSARCMGLALSVLTLARPGANGTAEPSAIDVADLVAVAHENWPTPGRIVRIPRENRTFALARKASLEVSRGC